MHAVVKESLEDYLSGLLEPVEEKSVEAHLADCASCREELDGMRSVSQLFVSLRPPNSISEADAVPSPSPAFYAKVVQSVEAQQSTRSTWASILALEFAMGRRLVLSSLLMLVLVGGWLVSREAGYSRGPSPDSILAQQNSPEFNSASGPDSMLATLTSYEH
jgi:anti-sigma factor RsiW